MAVLRTVRDVDPPDWLVGGGVLRDLVWDRLHDRPEPVRHATWTWRSSTHAAWTRAGTPRSSGRCWPGFPGVPWDAKNQAAVHRWYGRVFGAEVPPLASAADGVGTWPETATAVAVRLLDGDELRAVAPCGLEDLFAMVCRRNPRRVSVDHYRRRLRDKRVAERWPKVTIVDP
jgi:uncharacterized protein